MSRTFYICLLSFWFMGVNSLFAIDASVNVSSFLTKDSPYLELSIHVVGSSTVFEKKGDSEDYLASVQVLYTISKNEEIVAYDKYILHSPLTKSIIDFVDQKRIQVEDGQYEVLVELIDMNEEQAKPFQYKKTIVTQSPNDLSMSSIQLIAEVQPSDKAGDFVKHGNYMELMPFNLCHQKHDGLFAYFELYGSPTVLSDDFYAAYHLVTGYVGEQGDTVMTSYQRLSPREIIPVLQHLDLSRTTSGNYHLAIEVRDRKKNLLLTDQQNLIRKNPDYDVVFMKSYNKELERSFVQHIDEDELYTNLECLVPIVQGEIGKILEQILDNKEVKSMKSFLFQFWSLKNKRDPFIPYNEYMQEVAYVNERFKANVGPAYKMDRGYIYLRYGPPNDVVLVEEEPSAPPYEIWVYSFLARTLETNVKFLFYNPSLAPGDFQLLHSTCREEVQNPRWELDLYSKSPQDFTGDPLGRELVKDNFGRMAKDYFHDF